MTAQSPPRRTPPNGPQALGPHALWPQRLSARIVLLAVAAAGIYVCLWNLGSANYRGDEVVYVEAGWSYFHGDVTPNREHPPFAKYLYGIAQLIAGPGPLGPRIVAGLCTLIAGALLYLWITREAGWRAGLAAAAMWLLLPRSNDDLVVRLDRHALLEPVMVVLLVAACWSAWEWRRRPERLWPAALAGALLACAALSKLTALTAVPGLLVLLWGVPNWRAAANGVGLAGLSAVVVGVLLYAPVDPVASITYMLEMQGAHNATGHQIEIADHALADAPWWAHVWFMLSGMGWPTFTATAIGLVLATTVSAQARLVTVLGAVFASMFLISSFGANVALAHYYEGWAWLPLAIAGIGNASVLPRSSGLPPLTRALALAAVLLAVLASVRLVAAVWTDGPSGIARVESVLAADPAEDGDIFVAGVGPSDVRRYLPDDGIDSLDALDGADVTAIIIGRDDREPVPEAIADLLAQRQPREVNVDGVRVYILDGRLVRHGDVLAIE